MGYPDFQTYNSLANLIAGALASAGIPVLGNPVQLYNSVATQGGPALCLVGATVEGNAWTPALTMAQAITTFDTYVNGNPAATAAKAFLAPGQYPSSIPAGDQAVINSGATLYLSVKPNQAMTPADDAALTAVLNMYKAAAPKLNIILWSEPQPAFAGAAQWLAYWAHYQPIIKAAGLRCLYNPGSSTGEASVATYWPTPTPDGALQDLYWSAYSNGITLGTLMSLCAQFGVAAGVGEWNVDASGNKTPTATQWNAFIGYLITTMTDQAAAGNPLEAIMFFMGGKSRTITNNQLLSKNAMQVAGFNQIVAALGGPVTAPGFTLAAGQTVPMPAISPSPVAKYAIANGLSYDLALNLIAGAGSTVPFAVLGMQWINDDIRSPWAAHTKRWLCPAGASTGTGTIITGRGPQLTKYLKVSLTNKDTVPMTGQFQLNSTSRTTVLDDIRWDAAVSVNVPGYTLAGGGAYGLSIGQVDTGNIAPGNSKTYLFSMFAGEVFLRVVVQGAAGVKTVHVNGGPQPPSVWGATNLISQFLPLSAAAGDNDQSWTFFLPRAPMAITVTNNDANTVTASMEMIGLEAA